MGVATEGYTLNIERNVCYYKWANLKNCTIQLKLSILTHPQKGRALLHIDRCFDTFLLDMAVNESIAILKGHIFPHLVQAMKCASDVSGQYLWIPFEERTWYWSNASLSLDWRKNTSIGCQRSRGWQQHLPSVDEGQTHLFSVSCHKGKGYGLFSAHQWYHPQCRKQVFQSAGLLHIWTAQQRFLVCPPAGYCPISPYWGNGQP